MASKSKEIFSKKPRKILSQYKIKCIKLLVRKFKTKRLLWSIRFKLYASKVFCMCSSLFVFSTYWLPTTQLSCYKYLQQYKSTPFKTNSRNIKIVMMGGSLENLLLDLQVAQWIASRDEKSEIQVRTTCPIALY